MVLPDSDVQKFAQAQPKVRSINEDYSAGKLRNVQDPAKARAIRIERDEKIQQVVKDAGMSRQQYNRISQAAMQDRELLKRISDAMRSGGSVAGQSSSSKSLEEQIEHLNQLIQEERHAEVKEVLDESPELAQHIKDPVSRLLLSGPRDLRIGRIASMLEKGFGTSIIVAKINGVEQPYKDFSIEEIGLLKELDFNDKIIAAMMNVTTELRKKEQHKAQREAELAEQKRILESSGGRQTHGARGGQATGAGGTGSGLAEEAGKAVGKEVGKQLLESLF